MARKATNYYHMLGIQPEVTALEIKNAYRKLAKNYHPDVKFHGKTDSQREEANQYMARLNEAYETLIDHRSRANYDSIIGVNGEGRSVLGKQPTGVSEEEEREIFLKIIFNPSRSAIVKVLAKYKKQLADLSQDIYDDQLVSVFELYVEEVENTLRKSANDLSSKKTPSTLMPAVQMMRYSIAQAVDGLEELQHFCMNYDYSHLHMAQNLFKEATDLLRKALQLTKA